MTWIVGLCSVSFQYNVLGELTLASFHPVEASIDANGGYQSGVVLNVNRGRVWFLYQQAHSTAPLHTPYRVCCIPTHHTKFRSQVKRDYPLNLSILIRGGEENNHDTLSNGE